MRFGLLVYIIFFFAIAWLTVIFVEEVIRPQSGALVEIEHFVPNLASLTANSAVSSNIFLPLLLKGRRLNPIEMKLIDSESKSERNFGGAVSVSGDVALVGAAPQGYPGPDIPGAVSFYRRNGHGWVEEAKKSDENPDDRYGWALSVNGDMALISDIHENYYSGEAYVYRFNGSTWQHVPYDTLRASDRARYDFFGSSVSLYDNVAVIGAMYDDDKGYSSGSAYVYRWDGKQWQEESKLLAHDGRTRDYFGSSVSIYGDIALIGAPNHDNKGNGSGAAYVYRWDGTQWQEQSKLLASKGENSGGFGGSVSLYEDFALIGSGRRGSLAYLFRWNGSDWQEVRKLVNHNNSTSAVSLRRNMALVGTSLYRWDEEGWQESKELIPSDRAIDSYLGMSISLSDDLALIGTPYDYANDSGSAYVYDLFAGNVPVIAVSPPTIQQAVIESAASMSETLSIKNNGTTPLEWSVSWTSNWLAITPTQGTIMPSDTLPLRVTLPSLPADAYTDTLTITSNAFNRPEIEVPLHFRVNKRTIKVKVTPSDRNEFARFGRAVSLTHNAPSSNMMALIGGISLSSYSGVAHLYRWDGLSWIEEAKLAASDGRADDRFGDSISLDGEWALIGAPGNAAAYLFRWNGNSWQEEVKLLANDEERDNENFGRAVSLSGDVALVASDESSYIYRFDGKNWQEEVKQHRFLRNLRTVLSVSVNDEVALVGGHQTPCLYQCYVATNMANLYRWNRTQWLQKRFFSNSDPLIWDVSTNGEQALIGMEGKAILYRFDGDSWQPDTTFKPSDGVVSGFGRSVAFDGDKILIGQYLYHWNGSEWLEEAKLGFDNDLPISLSGDVALVGSLYFGSSYYDAAYFYHLAAEDGPKVTLSEPHIQRTLNIGQHTTRPLTITNHSTNTLSWQASISDTTWLNITPTFGILMSNQSQPLSVTLNATAVERGHYTDTISFTMGPPLSATLETPVRLTVKPAETKLNTNKGD